MTDFLIHVLKMTKSLTLCWILEMIYSFCVSFVSESRKGRDSICVIFDTVYIHVYEITHEIYEIRLDKCITVYLFENLYIIKSLHCLK